MSGREYSCRSPPRHCCSKDMSTPQPTVACTARKVCVGSVYLRSPSRGKRYLSTARSYTVDWQLPLLPFLQVLHLRGRQRCNRKDSPTQLRQQGYLGCALETSGNTRVRLRQYGAPFPAHKAPARIAEAGLEY